MTTRTRSKPTANETDDAVVDDEATEDTAASEQENTNLRHDVSEEEAEAERDSRIADLVPAGRRRPRASLPLTHEAMLVRGLSYRLVYDAGQTLILWSGRRTPINREEFEYLSSRALDTVATRDFDEDGEDAVQKQYVHKFAFYELGSDVELDVDIPEYDPPAARAGDAFDEAASQRSAMRKRRRTGKR